MMVMMMMMMMMMMVMMMMTIAGWSQSSRSSQWRLWWRNYCRHHSEGKLWNQETPCFINAQASKASNQTSTMSYPVQVLLTSIAAFCSHFPMFCNSREWHCHDIWRIFPNISGYWCLLFGFVLFAYSLSVYNSFFEWPCWTTFHHSLFGSNAATCCYYAAITLYMVESALGSGTFGTIDWRLWTYFISISRTGICAAIVMSQKIHTEASYSILRFIQNSKQKSGCRCSQTFRSSTSLWPHPRLCVDSWITHDYSTMLKCILNCFALFIAALWISKRRDLMGYGISWNTMRCRYYEM